jgi:hypothetical protein
MARENGRNSSQKCIIILDRFIDTAYNKTMRANHGGIRYEL